MKSANFLCTGSTNLDTGTQSFTRLNDDELLAPFGQFRPVQSRFKYLLPDVLLASLITLAGSRPMVDSYFNTFMLNR